MSQENQIPLTNRTKKARRGWAMYDWANSVYSLCITTAIFPIYFHAISKQVATKVETNASGVEEAFVSFLGMELKSITMISIAFAIAYSIIAIISPLLSGIADYSGSKKKFMIFFCGIGSVACALMYFFEPSTYYLGFWLFIIAAIGFAGGLIFNDAFLPEVSAPEDYDKTSALGYSLGYIGSVILLIFNLSMILFPEAYYNFQGKIDELMAADSLLTLEAATESATNYFSGLSSRISFLTVGIWWFGFAQITFFSLKDVKPKIRPKNYITEGFRELKNVLAKIKSMKLLKRYLLAYFFFNMALQTVMVMASSYGAVELKMGTSELIITVLLIQIIAVPGAFLFAWASTKIGNFKTLLIGIIIWIIICLGAYFFVHDAMGFYILGGFVGLVMGGMQSLARSTYSKLVPATKDTASFFSFYQITDKIAIIFGTFTFGVVSQYIGTKNSLLALIVFFCIGGFFIYQLTLRKPLKT